MPVRIEKTLTLRTLGADLVVLPMHARHMFKSLTIHPTLSETCLVDYPLAYSYYRNEQKKGDLKRGDILYYENIEDIPVVVMIARGDIRRKFDLHATVKCLKWMREQDLHNRYSIAFPGLGCYEDDRISPKIVFRMLKKYLGDGEKPVHYVVNY